MAHQNRLLLTEHIKHAHQVTNEVEQRIHGNIIGLVGLAVSAQIGGDDMVSRGIFVAFGSITMGSSFLLGCENETFSVSFPD